MFPWWPSIGQCFPERQREQFPLGGCSTVFLRRPYFRRGMSTLQGRRPSKIAAISTFFEPRHVLDGFRDLDVGPLTVLVFGGLEGCTGRFGFLNHFFCNFLAFTHRFLCCFLGGLAGFGRRGFGFTPCFLGCGLGLASRFLGGSGCLFAGLFGSSLGVVGCFGSRQDLLGNGNREPRFLQIASAGFGNLGDRTQFCSGQFLCCRFTNTGKRGKWGTLCFLCHLFTDLTMMRTQLEPSL